MGTLSLLIYAGNQGVLFGLDRRKKLFFLKAYDLNNLAPQPGAAAGNRPEKTGTGNGAESVLSLMQQIRRNRFFVDSWMQEVCCAVRQSCT